MLAYSIFYQFSHCLIFSVFTRISADTPLGCDEGWVQNNNYCYRFYNTKAVTWQQASDECNRYDSSLLYFDNIAEEVNLQYRIIETIFQNEYSFI